MVQPINEGIAVEGSAIKGSGVEGAVKVAVLGAGAFGTVIANMLADNGHDVTVWLKDKAKATLLQSSFENKVYLPGYPLNKALKFTDDITTCCESAAVVFVSVPSKAYRSVLAQLAGAVTPEQAFVSTAKGIEDKTFCRMSEVISEVLKTDQVGVLSGPNLAKEVAQKKLTATVIASEHERIIAVVQGLLAQSYFRVYGSQDVYAVELGGTLKNIYGIAAGMACELGMGANTNSMLMTRSLAEMSRFVTHLGGNPATFLGLAGVGDLIVTCSSPLSRNFQLGVEIAKGATLERALENMQQTVEGVNTVRMVKQKADELDIYMPIVEGLYRILFAGEPIGPIIHQLMVGDQNRDVEYIFQPQS